MRCEELMKRATQCVGQDEAVQIAARKMKQENVGFLPVCDADGRVLGTITDRDIAIRAVAEDMGSETPVAGVMTREVVACKAGDDLHRAEELMALHHKSRIMCLDADGRLAGVISLSDLVQRGEPAAAGQLLQRVSAREVRA